MIIPLFDYCNIAWSSLLQENQDRLQRLKNKICQYNNKLHPLHGAKLCRSSAIIPVSPSPPPRHHNVRFNLLNDLISIFIFWGIFNLNCDYAPLFETENQATYPEYPIVTVG